MRWAGHTLLGTVVYLMTLGSVEPLDAAVGVIVSALLVLFARRHLLPERPGPAIALHRRLLGVPGVAWSVARAVVTGTVDVARVSLRPERLRNPGLVEVRLPMESDAGVTAFAVLWTLSPGDLAVDIDRERGILTMHVLDASDPEALQERYEALYREHLAKVVR